FRATWWPAASASSSARSSRPTRSRARCRRSRSRSSDRGVERGMRGGLRSLARALPAGLLAALVALIGFAVLAVPATARADEVIERYDATIDVRTDGDLDVTETITVRAEGAQIRRGIFRDFPLRF